MKDKSKSTSRTSASRLAIVVNYKPIDSSAYDLSPCLSFQLTCHKVLHSLFNGMTTSSIFNSDFLDGFTKGLTPTE